MMTRFRVRNYKCLKDVDIPLTPIHVLIGQNDSGKTSLLEAMYALFKSSESMENAFPGDWSGTELVYLGSQEPKIELGATAWDSRIGSVEAFAYLIELQFRQQPGRTIDLLGRWP